MKFSAKTKNILGHYVYGLIDPKNDELFYVGKATKNNRPNQHLKIKADDNDKAQRINEIMNSGLKPRIDILRYGLESKDIALEVEAAIIDSIGLENLTNEKRGHGVTRGRQRAEDIERTYGSKPIDVSTITSPYMLFYIHETYSSTMNEQQIYDCTRQFWHKVSKANRENIEVDTALAIVNGVVVRVYKIISWYEAGTTFSSRKFDGREERWEFVGQRIDDHPLLDRLLVDNSGAPLEGNQKGYRYLPLRT